MTSPTHDYAREQRLRGAAEEMYAALEKSQAILEMAMSFVTGERLAYVQTVYAQNRAALRKAETGE